MPTGDQEGNFPLQYQCNIKQTNIRKKLRKISSRG